MKVTVLQLNTEWGSAAQNIERAERLIAQSPGSDLYVLPEMWSTGFAIEPSGIAEDEADSIALQWMRKAAREHQCAICGSLAIKSGGYRNRHYFIDGRSGTEQYYDKHHLFSYGHEDQYYTPGAGHAIVEYCGFRLLLLTCYDLRFPVWARDSDHLQYDAIICVANWPESRQNAWQVLTRARAIENQAYFIACNRVGSDATCQYRGQSAVISPIGKTLASCRPNVEESATACLTLESLHHLREKFPVLGERDIF